MTDLLDRSRRLNAALGGDPRHTFCGRLWRWRIIAWPLVLPIDLTFYLWRGGHCRECAEFDAHVAERAEALERLRSTQGGEA